MVISNWYIHTKNHQTYDSILYYIYSVAGLLISVVVDKRDFSYQYGNIYTMPK